MRNLRSASARSYSYLFIGRELSRSPGRRNASILTRARVPKLVVMITTHLCWLPEHPAVVLFVSIFVSTNTTILNLGGAIFERKHRHETFLIELKCKASFPRSCFFMASSSPAFIFLADSQYVGSLAPVAPSVIHRGHKCCNEQICFQLTVEFTQNINKFRTGYRTVTINQQLHIYLGHPLISVGTTTITMTCASNR